MDSDRDITPDWPTALHDGASAAGDGARAHLEAGQIDRLVDGELVWPEAAAHLGQCARCCAEVDGHLALVAVLERLPHLTPSPRFADHVMAEVAVFEPWYVALADTARALVPASPPARILAGVMAGVGAVTLSALALVMAADPSATRIFFGLLLDRLQTIVVPQITTSMADLVGGRTVIALEAHGMAWLAAALATGMAIVVGCGAAGMRAIVNRARGAGMVPGDRSDAFGAGSGEAAR